MSATTSIERGAHIAPRAKAYLRANSTIIEMFTVWDRAKAVEAVYIAFAEGRRLGQIEMGGEL